MQRDPLIGKIPVSLITGFLGSGKTTLIARLLRHPAMDKVAVIINKVGEIGIDHDLVAMSSESVSLLANGCLCCTVRTDLQDTLRELFGDRRAGRIPDFDRVMIETTGLADPVPVLQTLTSDTMLSAQYRIDGVVTLADAVNALSQLDSDPQAEKQIAHADRIFITKVDLSNTADMTTLRLPSKALTAWQMSRSAPWVICIPRSSRAWDLSAHGPAKTHCDFWVSIRCKPKAVQPVPIWASACRRATTLLSTRSPCALSSHLHGWPFQPPWKP